MTLTNSILQQLITPKQGRHTTRLPGKSARTNAGLIAFVKAKESKGVRQ